MPRSLPPLTRIERLLIVKTSSIGDVVHALPVIQAIKEARPALTLGWVVRRRCADVLRGNPCIDHLYVMPDKPTLAELSALRRELRTVQYQMALDMQGLLLSGIVTALSGAPIRIGWDRNREASALFLTHPIIPGKAKAQHEIDLLYGFAEALGVSGPHPEFTPQPHLAVDGAAKADAWLADLPRPRIALNVGASRAYKRWPAKRWAQVSQELLASGRSLVFVGDNKDAESVAALTPMLTVPFVNLAGQTTLRELAAVLAACDLLITADTGPMHIAVAVGTPVIALFGATDPRRHGPYGGRNIILHNPMPGAVVTGKRPTAEAGTACMARITVADVLMAVDTKCSNA